MGKRITRAALLTAIALILYLVEAQIPPVVPIPGVKLGLANIVTVYAMFALTPWEALAILLVRIFLGSVFAGAISAILYSLAGGLLCWLVMLLLRKLLTEKQIWVASVLGATAHNLGQTLAAAAILQTPSIFVYLPVLLLTGIVTGLFTGLAAQFALARLKRIKTP